MDALVVVKVIPVVKVVVFIMLSGCVRLPGLSFTIQLALFACLILGPYRFLELFDLVCRVCSFDEYIQYYSWSDRDNL